MGCDIHGWVEIKNYGFWNSILKIDLLINRNYDMFGSLFGVRNYANFRPVAKSRGIPDDISWETKADIERWGYDGHSHSFITYKEIKDIDWEEYSIDFGNRVFVYSIKKGDFIENWLLSTELTDEDMDTLYENKVLVKEDKIYMLRKLKRKHALTRDWKLLFDIMDLLAKEVGEDNVRLVVWFDN